jgi:hypothetical protein
MVEKINKTSNKKIVMISALLMIIILIIGFTYAYWTRNFTQSGTNISKYKCFNVTYKENVEGITLENEYPISDEEGMQQEPYEVEITNTCETVASYNVVLNKMNTTTVKDEYIKIGMNEEIKKLSELNTIDSTLENASYGKILKTGVLGGKESTTISVRSWMDIDTPEEEGTNKIFENKITIESVAGNKQLAALILANNELKTKTPDFSVGEPTAITYKEVGPTEVSSSLSATKAGNKPLGSSYTFNDETGRYTLVETKTNQTYDENSIGKYTCSYSDGVNCTEIYKIKAVDTTSSDTNNSIILADKYTYASAKESKNSGLYKAEDDDGDSYYFRGDIKNNYVSFANILWRVVRINGSGTIRLIAQQDSITTAFNSDYSYGKTKYYGYTYDNDHICTKENPCLTTTGTSSTIKTNLENWYTTNLNDYDDKIALESFCNDTLIANDTDFMSYSRIGKADKITLKCNDTLVDYGGVYKLKIATITADEINFAGLDFTNDKIKASNNNYLNFYNSDRSKTDIYLVMTPRRTRGQATWRGYYGRILTGSHPAEQYEARPVINLKADTIVSSGIGTKENPYVIN